MSDALATAAQFILAFTVMALVAVVLSAHATWNAMAEAADRRAARRQARLRTRRTLAMVGAVSL